MLLYLLANKIVVPVATQHELDHRQVVIPPSVRIPWRSKLFQAMRECLQKSETLTDVIFASDDLYQSGLTPVEDKMLS
jgi:hypothetical protein